MSPNKKSCPVPFDQQPLNEYEALKRSILFSLSKEKLPNFSRKLIAFFSLLSCIYVLLNITAFSLSKISSSTILDSFLFASCSIEALLVRLYLGWSYILKRLSSATIFYEESGWYDGQLWIKSADLLTQDRLVAIYQVEPLVSRMKNFFIINSIIVFALFIVKQIS